MQSTCSSLLILNQETQRITSEDYLHHTSPFECNFYHSDTDLFVDGCHSAEDTSAAKDFTGNHEEHELLSKDAPKTIQWKSK